MLRPVIALALAAAAAFGAGPAFNVSFPKERSATPLDGRLLLVLSTDRSAAHSQEPDVVWGADLKSWRY